MEALIWIVIGIVVGGVGMIMYLAYGFAKGLNW
jgi:hypothetical protein